MIPILLLLALSGRPAVPPGQLIKAAKLGPAQIREVISRFELSKSATREGEFKTHRFTVRIATSSAQLKRRAVMGIIRTINGNTLTLSHQIRTTNLYTVFLTSDTVIKSKSATTSAALAVGQRIVVVGALGEGGIVAKLIHIIPGRATGLFNRQPTASPSASPSVTPTVSPTTTPIPISSPTPTPAV